MSHALDDEPINFGKIEKDLLSDMKTSFGDIGKEVISSKIATQQLFAQSSQEGGPTSVNGAIVNLMKNFNIGYRHLSVKTGVKRKLLVSMIEGRVSMPPEVLQKICAVFESRQPSLFNFSDNPNKPLTKKRM